jgi:hypothetical protein
MVAEKMFGLLRVYGSIVEDPSRTKVCLVFIFQNNFSSYSLIGGVVATRGAYSRIVSHKIFNDDWAPCWIETFCGRNCMLL